MYGNFTTIKKSNDLEMRWLAMWRNNFSNLISYSGTKCWKMAKNSEKTLIFRAKNMKYRKYRRLCIEIREIRKKIKIIDRKCKKIVSFTTLCDLEEEILIRFSLWNELSPFEGYYFRHLKRLGMRRHRFVNLGHPNRSSYFSIQGVPTNDGSSC